jgi:murein L,D-transpeptidase YcbB/YkuD
MKAPLKYILVVLLVYIGIQSCGDSSKRTKVEPAKFKSGLLKKHIEVNLENKDQDYEFRDTLQEFYANRKYRPIWQDILMNDSLTSDLFNFTNKFIKEEGLFIEPFNLALIHSFLPDTPFVYNEEFYEKMASVEVVISNAMMLLHRDSKVGSLEPKKLFKSFYDLPIKTHPTFNLFAALDPSHFKDSLDHLRLNDSNYTKYKLIMDSLYTLLPGDTAYVQIDTAGIKKIEVGDSTKILPQIAQNLHVMGLISAKAVLKANAEYYNKEFKYYIRIAQSAFGLHDDGIIGRRSLRMFNQSISQKIDEVKINMERERWIERPEETPFVLVNLPQYELFLHYVDSVKSMDICIGKPRTPLYDAQMTKYNSTGRYWDKPRDFETPQIFSHLEYFVLNPTWRVPRSIVVREMYHQMRRDSNYLRKNNYEVYRKDEKLNPDTINWRRFSATRIPYRFVQTWGDHNALGKVKYIFRNKHHIYFHDTPQKSKFKWTQRSVSHGCVRLSEPILMGDFVLKEHKKYNYDDFRIFLGYEPLDEERLEEYDPQDSIADIRKLDETKLVHLDGKIPVYFLYRTVWLNEDGRAEFHADMYGKNEEIHRSIMQKMANLPQIQ